MLAAVPAVRASNSVGMTMVVVCAEKGKRTKKVRGGGVGLGAARR